MRHVDRVQCPITVAYGSKESPEFKRHGRSFAAELMKRGAPVRELILEGQNHFEGIRTMIDSDSPLARAVLGAIGAVAAPAA